MSNKQNLMKRIETLKELNGLFKSVKNNKVRDLLHYHMWSEFDNMVNNIETIYFDIVVNNDEQMCEQLENERHNEIVTSKNMLNTFLPYMMMYSIIQQDTLLESNSI